MKSLFLILSVGFLLVRGRWHLFFRSINSLPQRYTAVSCHALDAWLILIRTQCGNVDPIGNGLAAKDDVANRVFAGVRAAERAHQLRIAVRASQIENMFFKPVRQAIAKTWRTRKQDE